MMKCEKKKFLRKKAAAKEAHFKALTRRSYGVLGNKEDARNLIASFFLFFLKRMTSYRFT